MTYNTRNNSNSDSNIGSKRLRCVGGVQQALDAQKQHEQLQQQVQTAQQQLEAAKAGNAEAECQLAQTQEGLDRYVAAC